MNSFFLYTHSLGNIMDRIAPMGFFLVISSTSSRRRCFCVVEFGHHNDHLFGALSPGRVVAVLAVDRTRGRNEGIAWNQIIVSIKGGWLGNLHTI